MPITSQLDSPSSVFVTPNNEVYIADYYNHRIRKILKNGNIVTIAGTGIEGFSGDGGPATSAQLYCPSCVFVSCNHEVYISDVCNQRIRKIQRNGNIVTIAGNGNCGCRGDGGPAINARLNNPLGLFVTPNDEVYIADCGNHRIRKILQNGNIITIAGIGIEGFSGDNEPAISAELSSPSSVFVSSNNEIYIDSDYGIRKILKKGNIITIAGNGTKGYSGDGGPAISAQFYYPSSIFVSPNNEIYIADSNNHVIRKILDNGNIVTIAGNGQRGYSGDNGPAISAQLYRPRSVFVTPNDEVYIADYYNHRIRIILRNGNIVTIAGNGNRKGGYSGDSEYDFSLYPHVGGSLYGDIDHHFIRKFNSISLFDCNFKFYYFTSVVVSVFTSVVTVVSVVVSVLVSVVCATTADSCSWESSPCDSTSSVTATVSTGFSSKTTPSTGKIMNFEAPL